MFVTQAASENTHEALVCTHPAALHLSVKVTATDTMHLNWCL